MAQSEKSKQLTGTRIEKAAITSFFWQTEMIRFLVEENLALKTLLFEKGLLTPEEFKAHKTKAEEMVKFKVDKHVKEWMQAHPDMVKLFTEAEQAAREKRPLEQVTLPPAVSPH